MLKNERYTFETIPIAEARTKLPTLCKELTEQHQAIAITVRGVPALAVMPWELFESIMETMDIMGDPEMMAALRQGIKEVEEAQGIPWEEAKAQLELK
jgi:prevent-host-death family protein